MKERRERTMAELLWELEPERAIQERFTMERRPEPSVDGDNEWERDLFEGEPVDVWQIIERDWEPFK